MENYKNLRFGKRPPVRDYRTFLLQNYLRDDIPSPPDSFESLKRVYENIDPDDPTILFPMMDNDSIGDCTIVGMAHGDTVWSALVGNKSIYPTELVRKIYFHLTGGDDTGLAMLTVLDYFRKNKVLGETIYAYMSLNSHNHTHVKQAINLFGGLFCVSPDTKVLTYDLKWKPAGELEKGEYLLAFDEEDPIGKGKGRRYKKASVTNNGLHKLECYKLYLSDGTSLIASKDHRWLVTNYNHRGNNWRSMEEIYNFFKKYSHKKILSLPRFIGTYNELPTYNSGFLSAAFDAEGSIDLHKTGWRDGKELRLQFSQNNNFFLEKVKGILSEENYLFSENSNGKCNIIRIMGGFQEATRFLMEARPVRLLSKWEQTESHCGLKAKEQIIIEDCEYIGEQYVSTLKTSSGTFIAEGFGAHNCGFQVQEKCLEEFKNRTPWKPGKLLNSGHAVFITGYDKEGLNILTWGNTQRATWGWWDWCVDEAYVVLPPEAINPEFAPGFDFAALKKDLVSVSEWM